MTNKEAIEKLREISNDYWDDDGYGGVTRSYVDGITAIDMAVEALQERKTGRWVLNHNQIDWGWDINCSVCGKGDEGFFASSRENAECKLKHQYLMDAKKRESMRYCNYCGAKMEVDE